jgi:carbon storage regulator
MLVLTRRPTESIIIANNIKITVVSIGPGRVKIGIEAPPNVRIDRQEIHDKIEQSADVLSAVAGGEATADAQNTMVGHGPDTAAIVFAPAAGTSAENPAPAPQAASTSPLSKLAKFRSSRKPR